MHHKEWHSWHSILFGAVLLLIGLLFLLNNLDILESDIGEIASTWWPVALILVGVGMMLNFIHHKRRYSEQTAPLTATRDSQEHDVQEGTEDNAKKIKRSPMSAFVLISLGVAFLADSLHSAHDLFLPLFFIGLGLGTLLKDRL